MKLDMKIKIILTFFIFSISAIFANTIFAEDSGTISIKSCEKYKSIWDKDFVDYCDKITACDTYNPNNNWTSILRIQTISFLPVKLNKQATDSGQTADENSELYRNFLDKITYGSFPYLWPSPLEQAKTVYTEVQNAIYNCAVLWTKIKVWENVIKLMTSANMWNQTAKIKAQNESMTKELSKRKCNTIWNKQVAFNEVLLKNVTYHYCNYRYYLNYLSKYPTYNLDPSKSVSSKAKSPWQDKFDTNEALQYAKMQTNAVQSETDHAKQVYNTAFNWFNELESTYGTHIMLQLIYDDYVQVRNNMSRILSPLSQLAYKIPNAQCQGKCN